MAWVVDTCVVLDVLEADPKFGQPSARKLQSLLKQGLVVCPVTTVELSPAFAGDLQEQKRFFDTCGIDEAATFGLRDMEAAHTAWNRYIQSKRHRKTPKRPIADILIGGFSLRFQGLVTRNPRDFERWFPGLKLIDPSPRKS